jgi:hypothetical protein
MSSRKVIVVSSVKFGPTFLATKSRLTILKNDSNFEGFPTAGEEREL